MTALIIVLVLMLAFWLWVAYLFSDSQTIWDWLVGEPSGLSSTWSLSGPSTTDYKGLDYKPYEPQEPVKPRERRDFGAHSNPLFNPAECLELFERFDARTWQCPKCLLMRFEKT